MGEIEIAFEGVSKRFGNFVALEDISFQVEKGEFLCVIGPAGCGKTLLLRLINGFERPTEGEIYVRGTRVNDVPAYRRGIPTVFQNFALLPHRTVYENVEYGLRLRKLPETERRRKVEEVLEKLDIPELRERYPNQISGGQKQRVGLARALVVEPSILILDEPLGALDANLRVRMQTELKGLHGRLGITFVLVTSNRTEAFAMGSRVMVMDMGRIAQIGKSNEIRYAPASEYVARFCGHTNIFAGAVMAKEDGVVTLDTPIGSLRAVALQEGIRIGDELKIYIRPDGIDFRQDIISERAQDDGLSCPIGGGQPSIGDNHVTGRLKHVEFGGSIITLFFDLGDGRELVVEKHASKVGRLKKKESFHLYWKPGCTGVIG